MTTTRKVGMAMSGGGHRATAWGFGALLGVLQVQDLASTGADEHLQVASIASVSGGSIANGVAAVTCPDLGTVSSSEALRRFGPALEVVAGDGLFFFSKKTNAYVFTFFAVAFLAVVATLVSFGGLVVAGVVWSVGRTMVLALSTVAGLALLVALKALARGGRSAGAVAKLVGTYVLGGLVAGALLGVGGILTRAEGPFPGHLDALAIIGIAVVLSSLAAYVWSRRGNVVRRAMESTHFTPGPDVPGGSGGLALSDLADRDVHHVFCTTDLQSGDQLYLSPRLVYGHMFGFARDTGTVSLASAVQASAALPGGFPPQVTRFEDGGLAFERPWPVTDGPTAPPDRMALVDGGVYDNLGEQWHVGWASRVAKWPGVTEIDAPVDLLVAANAGKAMGWSDFTASGWLGKELAGLVRDQSIQYDQSTAPRRTALIRRFAAAEAGVGGPKGVLVHIATSPRKYCTDIIDGKDTPAEKRVRAAEWLPVLDSDRTGDDWLLTARNNANVKTTLAGIGPSRTVELVFHAAVLTRVALHVHHGLGPVELPDKTAIYAAIGAEPPKVTPQARRL